jgi:hypothetical protein
MMAICRRGFIEPLKRKLPFGSGKNLNSVNCRWSRCAGWSTWPGVPVLSGSS